MTASLKNYFRACQSVCSSVEFFAHFTLFLIRVISRPCKIFVAILEFFLKTYMNNWKFFESLEPLLTFGSFVQFWSFLEFFKANSEFLELLSLSKSIFGVWGFWSNASSLVYSFWSHVIIQAASFFDKN